VLQRRVCFDGVRFKVDPYEFFEEMLNDLDAYSFSVKSDSIYVAFHEPQVLTTIKVWPF